MAQGSLRQSPSDESIVRQRLPGKDGTLTAWLFGYGWGVTMKKALSTGVTGQDGSYFAEFFLGKGCEVYGVIRRSNSFNRTAPLFERSSPESHP